MKIMNRRGDLEVPEWLTGLAVVVVVIFMAWFAYFLIVDIFFTGKKKQDTIEEPYYE